MKKTVVRIISVVLLIFCCFGIGACNSDFNSNFELVKSITITTNGEEKKFSSSTSPQIRFDESESKYITAGEFDCAPENRKFEGVDGFGQISFITVSAAIRGAKNTTCYEVVEKDLEGYWYHKYSYTPSGKVYYRRYKYEKTYFNFVYVKVKNDTTVVIKSGSKETTYTVTSYSIVKF